jgi:hypothetical protein
LEDEKITFLPSHWSYKKLLKLFKSLHPHVEKICLRTFENIWKFHDELRYIKIRSPKKDVCDECSIFRTNILDLDELAYTDASEKLFGIQKKHIEAYQFMKAMYKKDIELTRDKSNEERPIVLSFDYAQNAELPHFVDQPASFYFWSLKKVYQFGVDEEFDSHIHSF